MARVVGGRRSPKRATYDGVRTTVWFGCAVSIATGQLVAGQFADPDLWGRLAIGAVIEQTGRVPLVDDFSFTARGSAWIDHEWLTGVVFHRVVSVLGEPGLIGLKYAALVACLASVFALHRRVYRVAPAWAGVGLILSSPVVALGFVASVRAQVFSFVFFSLFLVALERRRLGHPRRWHWLWLLPAGVLWGNLHGGVAMGVILIGIYGVALAAAGRRTEGLRLLALAPGILLLLAAANPYGPRYLRFLLGAWTLDRSAIPEWGPLLSGPGEWRLTLTAALAAAAAALAVHVLRRAWRDRSAALLAPALVLLQLVAMTLLAVRIAPFLALGLTAYLPACVPSLARRPAPAPPSRRRLGLELALPALATAAALTALPLAGRPWLASVVPDETQSGARWGLRYPAGAVFFLLSSPYGGSLLNRFNDGEFLLWNLYPRFRIAVDGRYEEVYSQAHFRAVQDFYKELGHRSPEAAVAFANESGADFILFPARNATRRAVTRDPGWAVLYDDGLNAILGRRSRLGRVPQQPRRQPPDRPLLTLDAFFDHPDPLRFARYPAGGGD